MASIVMQAGHLLLVFLRNQGRTLAVDISLSGAQLRTHLKPDLSPLVVPALELVARWGN